MINCSDVCLEVRSVSCYLIVQSTVSCWQSCCVMKQYRPHLCSDQLSILAASSSCAGQGSHILLWAVVSFLFSDRYVNGRIYYKESAQFSHSPSFHFPFDTVSTFPTSFSGQWLYPLNYITFKLICLCMYSYTCLLSNVLIINFKDGPSLVNM